MADAANVQVPMPRITELNRPYFDGLRAGRLMLQRCGRCDAVWFPPSPRCSQCLHDEPSWFEASGRGVVWSHIVMHRPYFASFKDKIPYPILMVRLDEGPMIISSLAEPSEEVACEDRVELVIREVGPDVHLPYFRRTPAEQPAR